MASIRAVTCIRHARVAIRMYVFIQILISMRKYIYKGLYYVSM